MSTAASTPASHSLHAIAIAGASGRMGRMLIEAIQNAPAQNASAQAA